MTDAVKTYKMISADYKYDADIMCEDDERVISLKKIINEKLSVADRTIFLLYTDLQSYRKLGEMMGLSHMTIRREVIRIKEIILREYEGNI
jgi:hypothetical protein